MIAYSNIDWQVIANIATIVYTFATLAALYFVRKQLIIQNQQRETQIKELELQNRHIEEHKKIIEADFFLKLFAEFRTYNELFTTAHFWEKNKKEFIESKEKGMIVSYLGFFESLYHFIGNNVISLEIIDDSFSYSFFSFVNNKQIQELELIPCCEDYKNIYRLYKIWKTFHLNQGKKISSVNGKELDLLDEFKLIIHENN